MIIYFLMQVILNYPEEHNVSETALGASCHGPVQARVEGLPLVVIVGTPNVGKSLLFNALTGAYVTVSNYPGTTVELSLGKGHLDGREVGIVDTPGMYRLLPITEEERVARHILLDERPAVVLHVVDAKNLGRMLPMTLQLMEAGLPVVLVVNLLDEAKRLGVQIDLEALERILGIPVVGTILPRKVGVAALKRQLGLMLNGHAPAPPVAPPVVYPPAVEEAVQALLPLLQGSYTISPRAVALLLLQGDEEVQELVRACEGPRFADIARIVERAQARLGQPMSYVIARALAQTADEIASRVMTQTAPERPGLAEKLNEITLNPWTGLPLLFLNLFLLYEFVGVLGAQILVDWLEADLFEGVINPWVNAWLAARVPWPALRDLIGGDYGIITLGVRYAVAIILPIVGTFFLAFSIIEDSGYLPRLALLIDRVFKRIGLNGRAVIPIVLGFGCDTMATVVTRTLETRRERIISTLLLALAIPCSAQLGVMMGLLGTDERLFLIWASVVILVFLLVGYLAAQILPGERPAFYMELPPLRRPALSNVLVKTYTRMEWYFREVLPLFILASVLIWLGKLTGGFDVLVRALVPLVRWVGLPDETAVAFLFGFFRRDYGAAGLYDLRDVMTARQLVVAAVTMTLFVPCIAQFSVTIKERGWKTALAISAFIFPFAFLVGGIVSRLLVLIGMS